MTELAEDFAKHMDRRVLILKEIVTAEVTISSVKRRMDNLDGNDAEFFRARDRLRHVEERLAELQGELIEVDGELSKVRFKAGIGWCA